MRTFGLAVSSLVLALGFAACATDDGGEGEGGGDDVAAQTCRRADTCNQLGGSVEECTQDLQSGLDDLSATDREQFEFELANCLDQPSCDGFFRCLDSIGQ